MLCIIRRITTCNKIKINCQVFQTKHGLCPASLFAVVCNIVAASSNIIHTFPNIVSDNIPEIFRINKALQIVLIRHIQLLFNRVHPFYRKFHRPAAVYDTCLRINQNNLLCRHGNVRKCLEFFFAF